MKKYELGYKKKQKGQGMVEFALAIPVFLLLGFGIIEFGRFFLVYISVQTAAREAVRYGISVGTNDAGVTHDQDCDGMIQAGQRAGFFAGIQPSNVDIRYDNGPDAAVSFSSLPQCPNTTQQGDRVVVKMDVPFKTLFGIVPNLTISSTAARTIVKDVDVYADLATPTPRPVTPTRTNTPTITLTPTLTYTPTITFTPSMTPTASMTPTVTNTATATLTRTPGPSPTPTQTLTPTMTLTPTLTSTPTITPSPTLVPCSQVGWEPAIIDKEKYYFAVTNKSLPNGPTFTLKLVEVHFNPWNSQQFEYLSYVRFGEQVSSAILPGIIWGNGILGIPPGVVQIGDAPTSQFSWNDGADTSLLAGQKKFIMFQFTGQMYRIDRVIIVIQLSSDPGNICTVSPINAY